MPPSLNEYGVNIHPSLEGHYSRVVDTVRFFGNFPSYLVSWTTYATEVRDLAEWAGQVGMSVTA